MDQSGSAAFCIMVITAANIFYVKFDFPEKLICA